MNKKERIERIIEILNEYFPDPKVPLDHQDAYTLLIAVVLSAHSTDKMVNKVTPALFAKASTPWQMAALSEEEIRELIKPCGLSQRKSKAVWQLSKMIIEKFDGEVPKTFEQLESLPGVGHKTASVIMAQAFNIPAFPVDTHIFRLARRWGLSKGKNVAQVEEDLKKIFPKKDWITAHLQIIFFARKFCPARGHRVEVCPICRELFGS